MHSSLIFLFLISIILIVLMITCFICFIRSRRKEDEEFMEQVQYGGNHHHRHHHHHHQPSPKLVAQASPSIVVGSTNSSAMQQHQNHQPRDNSVPLMIDYTTATLPSGANAGSSPYHTSTANAALHHQQQHHNHQPQQQVRPEIRSDITQQINSAIIGSSEAEFQNDFIQVFPMYQIAPQPEKNTTPYLT